MTKLSGLSAIKVISQKDFTHQKLPRTNSEHNLPLRQNHTFVLKGIIAVR